MLENQNDVDDIKSFFDADRVPRSYLEIGKSEGINPNHPTGLEPEPKTVDTVPLLHEQFKRPVNHENRRERHDMEKV